MSRKLHELAPDLLRMQLVIAASESNIGRMIAIVAILKVLTDSQLRKLARWISDSSEAIESKDPDWIAKVVEKIQ